MAGYQRSGTTLLQALLGAHQRIAAPPEMYFVARISDHAAYFGSLDDDANLARVLREALNPPLDFFADCGFDFDRILKGAKAGPRTYAGLFDAIMRDYAARAGKERWSDKSPGQPIDAVYGLFPDAQVIHIVRDPRDVIASSLETPWTEPDPAWLARDWRRFVLKTIRRGFAAGPSQFLQIRYEDLTRDPHAVLRLVCTFLNEPYDPGMTDDPSRRAGTVPRAAAAWQQRALRPVAPANEGSWRQRLGRADRVRVSAIVGSTLVPLGYEPPSFRTNLAGWPLRMAEGVAREGSKRRRRPSPSPEQRYRAMRVFMEGRATLAARDGKPVSTPSG